MVTTHKISAELYDDSFELIALHTGLEGYAMAYQLNSTVGLRLHRCKSDIEFGDNAFPVFEWQDDLSEEYWVLYKNIEKTMEESGSIGLFSQSMSTKTVYLIEERKEVDFFLKVTSDDRSKVKSALNRINTIPKVVTAYQVEHASLKSRRNLIL